MKKAAIVLLLALSPGIAWSQAKYQTAEEALAAEDYPAALEILRKEARRGDLRSARRIGEMYLEGEGVEKSPAEALRWFLRAAKPDIRRARFKEGLPEAQLAVARMYRDGIGTEVDPKKAARWYKEAAERDQGEAQLAIAEMYLRGQGVRQDYASAYRWAARAHNNLAEEDAEKAASLQEEAKQHLTEQELAELQEQVEEAGPRPL